MLDVHTPASNPRGEAGIILCNVQAMHPAALKMPLAAPASKEPDEIWTDKAVVPTAPTHQVRSKNTIREAYANAPSTPAKLPRAARSRPSRRKRLRISGGANPSALRRPTSLKRCSIPSLKNRVASKSAEATRKKLK